jgi:hypothetical protein
MKHVRESAYLFMDHCTLLAVNLLKCISCMKSAQHTSLEHFLLLFYAVIVCLNSGTKCL